MAIQPSIINKSHIRIGEFIIQATTTADSWHKTFIVLDEEENQIGPEHEHVTDAIEDALIYGNSPAKAE